MDDARRSVLTAELDAAVRQRDELNVVIEYLGRLVGRQAPNDQANKEPDEAALPNASADPVALVGDGEFFGKSSTEAAAEVLARVGRSRPLKTEAIFEAVTKGGVKITTAALYRGLFRSPKFTRVGKSLWGLTEWYPAGARAKAAKSAEQEQQSELAELADVDAPAMDSPSTDDGATDLSAEQAVT